MFFHVKRAIRQPGNDLFPLSTADGKIYLIFLKNQKDFLLFHAFFLIFFFDSNSSSEVKTRTGQAEHDFPFQCGLV